MRMKSVINENEILSRRISIQHEAAMMLLQVRAGSVSSHGARVEIEPVRSNNNSNFKRIEMKKSAQIITRTCKILLMQDLQGHQKTWDYFIKGMFLVLNTWIMIIMCG